MAEELEQKVNYSEVKDKKGFLGKIKDFFSSPTGAIAPIIIAMGLIGCGGGMGLADYEKKMNDKKASVEQVYDQKEQYKIVGKDKVIYIQDYKTGEKKPIAADWKDSKDISFTQKGEEIIYKKEDTEMVMLPIMIGSQVNLVPTSQTSEKYYSVKKDTHGQYTQKNEITKAEYSQKRYERNLQIIEEAETAKAGRKSGGLEMKAASVNLVMLITIALSFFIFSGVSITGYSVAEINAGSVISYWVLSLIGILYLFSAIVIFAFRRMRE